jgi:hypothetical protein
MNKDLSEEQIQDLKYQPDFKEPPPEITERIREAVDISHMSKTLFVIVGAGGAQTICENIVRMGGNIAVIDPDKVESKNIGTQGVYGDEIGQYKVDALKARLKTLNPNANIFAITKYFEEICDQEFEMIAQITKQQFGGAPGYIIASKYIQVVVCGFTDNFEAQDRVNSICLKYGLPGLNAQIYANGYAGEITYIDPRSEGKTTACMRCCLSPRYRAYLEEGFQNDVGSDGTPIYATEAVNALKGFILTALGHTGLLFGYSSSHPRWETQLTEQGNKNLIQISFDPKISKNLGMQSFDRTFHGADQSRMAGSFFQTQFIPQSPEGPCPSCGGTGNLSNATFSWRDEDTRIIRRVFPSNKSES